MKVDRKNVASIMLATLLAVTSIDASAQGADMRVVTGRVTDGKTALANVAVTDGLNVVRTGSDGYYTINTPVDSRYVYISIPSGYKVSVEKGTLPQFYQPLTAAQQSYDFILTRNPNDDTKHTFIVQSDAQVTSKEDIEQYKTIVADCRTTIEQISGDVFGFDCGDIVGDSPWLYPDMIDAAAPLDIPIFRAIGNHDMNYYGRTHETSYETFETIFGPSRYSFNKGNAHYIVLDNTFFIGRDYFYMGYIDETTFRWLEQDLASVKKGSPVFVVMHIPSQLTDKAQQFKYDYFSVADQTVNAGALHNMLKSYNAHIITGHMHYNLNMEFGDNVMEHNTAAACGTWWQLKECIDGTPRGYAVYEVAGDKVEWYYKSANYARDYQMHVYGIGECDEYPADVVANVWNYDSKWKVELLENGKKTADMLQYCGYDPYTKAQCSDRSKLKYEWIYPIENQHMFRATPVNPAAELQVKVIDRFGNVYIQNVNKR